MQSTCIEGKEGNFKRLILLLLTFPTLLSNVFKHSLSVLMRRLFNAAAIGFRQYLPGEECPTLKKRKIEFSLYSAVWGNSDGSGCKVIYEDIYEEGLSYIWEMRKYLVIYEEDVSHIWLCNRSLLDFLMYEEYLVFYFYQCRQSNPSRAVQTVSIRCRVAKLVMRWLAVWQSMRVPRQP
jgi:hypothetical protein